MSLSAEMPRNLTCILAVAGLTLLCIPCTALASIIRVPSEQPTIQDGIDASEDGDTVLVADGTYVGVGNKNLDYKGVSIHLMSENGAEQTVIDCENSGRGFYFHNDENSLAIVEGFTIRNGYVTGEWHENDGGGIFCNAASPTIQNCIIAENTAEGTGGGVSSLYPSLASISKCTVIMNVANAAGGIDGGKFIIDSDISGNTGVHGGGGVYSSTETVISSCIINSNTGGGVYSGGDQTITISDCTISGNTNERGGGIYVGSAEPTVTNCIIAENIAEQYEGGGIYISFSGSISLTDCIIAGNVGAGIYSSGYPDLTNCTVAGNSRGGVKCIGSYAYATIVNCIFWDNGDPEIDDDNGWTDVDYSTVQGAIWPGTGNIMSNPRFVDPRNGDFRLLPESPCIDAGDPSYTPRTGGGRRIDMGAIEHFLGFNFSKGAMSQTRRVPQDYPTIQEAIDVAVYLDTILVADGTYTGEGNKNIEFLGKTIIVQSETGPESTVIDCENDGRGFYFQDSEVGDAKLVGFKIINGSIFSYGGGIRCDSSSPSILECCVTNCDASTGGGVYCAYTNTTIANCLIAYNQAIYGGGLSFGGSEDNFFQLYNTILICNDASQDGGGIECGSSSNIFNCTVYENSAEEGGGISFMGWEYDSPIVANCIFWDDPATEISVVGWTEPIITYSDIAGGWPGEGNIDADPLFVDPENGDFHLTVDSPCIDTGTLEGSPEFDFEGDPRPQGDGVDMGADEYSDAVTRIFIQKQQIPVLNVHSREIQPKNKWIIK